MTGHHNTRFQQSSFGVGITQLKVTAELPRYENKQWYHVVFQGSQARRRVEIHGPKAQNFGNVEGSSTGCS
jgi:hypothetical protein